MKQNIIVLARTKYNTVDKETGVIQSGTSIEYVSEDSTDEKGDSYSKKGYFPFKMNLTEDVGNIVDTVPCLCEADLQMKSTSKDRQPRLTIVGLKKIGDYVLKFTNVK